MHWKDIEILFEDNHLLVISKPVGVVVQADETGSPDVLSLLKQRRKIVEKKPGEAFVGLVHRLDRNVGGVMVFAKTSKAASRLSEQIRKKSIEKTYLCVLEGCPPEQGILEDYLFKDETTNTSRVVTANHKSAKLCQLEYVRLQCHEQTALVKVHLITGRSHQIRVQFASRGWPLWGDGRYGKRTHLQAPIALWSHQLSFQHPVNGQSCTYQAWPPKQLPWTLFKV